MIYLLLQSSSALQWQKMVQLSPFALQLHLLFAHGVSLLQPHFKSLSSSVGARGLSEGTMVGERAALPSGWYHPCFVGSRAGGSVLRQSRQMATARLLSECCLSWRKGAEYFKYTDYLLSEPSHQPSHRICVERRRTHQANHAG